MLQYKTKGYFTLEASILVPLVFFVFALIIHLLFFSYGRGVVVQDSYLIAFRASMLRDDEDVTAFATSNAAKQFGGKYFGNDVPTLEVKKEGNYVITTATSSTHRSAFDLLSGELWRYGAKAKAIDVNVPKRIRKIDRVADLLRAGIAKAEEIHHSTGD